MKEVDENFEENEIKQENGTPCENTEASIGIRPRPLICKPGHVNVGCKSEPLETKWHWAPGAWQDATRTSAFQPYKVNFHNIKFILENPENVIMCYSSDDYFFI